MTDLGDAVIIAAALYGVWGVARVAFRHYLEETSDRLKDVLDGLRSLRDEFGPKP